MQFFVLRMSQQVSGILLLSKWQTKTEDSQQGLSMLVLNTSQKKRYFWKKTTSLLALRLVGFLLIYRQTNSWAKQSDSR